MAVVAAAIASLIPPVASTQSRQPVRQPGGVGLMVFTDINFSGESMPLRTDIPDLQTTRFNDGISSLRVAPGEQWEVCEHTNYQGRCAVATGSEADLRRGDWNDIISSARRLEQIGTAQSLGQRSTGMELYADAGFRGDRRAFAIAEPDLRRAGFNDAAQSLRVAPGQAWEVCEHTNFVNCTTIDSDVNDLRRVGISGAISSVRPAQRVDAAAPGSYLVFYDDRGFRGRAIRVNGEASNLAEYMDRAESVQVVGGSWQLCERASFAGRCLVVSENLPDLYALGLREGVGSARRVAVRR